MNSISVILINLCFRPACSECFTWNRIWKM